jgi:hypothetical protein
MGQPVYLPGLQLNIVLFIAGQNVRSGVDIAASKKQCFDFSVPFYIRRLNFSGIYYCR